MNIRTATPGDKPAIRDVVRRSMQASYSLDPKTIVGAIQEWYDEERLTAVLEDDGKLLLVAERDDQVVGFTDSVITGEGTAELLWLHVDPDYRSEDYGKQLYEATRDRLAGRGATTLRGRVLADNADGNAFYERQGLTKVGETEVEVDGTPHVENIYAEDEQPRLEAVEGDGRTVYVDHEDQERGSVAPFDVVYTNEDGEDLYGYWCSNCERLSNAMDPMGRIQCDACGNARKPTRWDSAYM
ncbi:MAG: ribosomal protein S18 acetylase RimI-like enzyme [Natronomonas sp.]|jgi:ribosomal protein S18 acetylase RimI-like enzyme